MLKKTLLATATAGLISAGALVGTAGSASAASINFGGPGWHVGIGTGPGFIGPRPRQVCQPVFQTVRWWDRWGRPHVKQVVVRQECRWVFGPGPFQGPKPGWNGGMGPNPGWGNPHPHP